MEEGINADRATIRISRNPKRCRHASLRELEVRQLQRARAIIWTLVLGCAGFSGVLLLLSILHLSPDFLLTLPLFILSIAGGSWALHLQRLHVVLGHLDARRNTFGYRNPHLRIGASQ
jgi:hypothetical protein